MATLRERWTRSPSMDCWNSDFDGIDPPRLGPRFCPDCGRGAPKGANLCGDCGGKLQSQGFCGICENFWLLPIDADCPKHEVALEPPPHSWPIATPHAGDVPSWVTVGVFTTPLRAEAPRIRLEAEGIPTFLEGERMGSASMYAVATGGVKLQVPQVLAADARVLLAQLWTPPAEDDYDDAWDDLAPDSGAIMRSVMRAVIVFLLIAPFLMTLLSLVEGR